MGKREKAPPGVHVVPARREKTTFSKMVKQVALILLLSGCASILSPPPPPPPPPTPDEVIQTRRNELAAAKVRLAGADLSAPDYNVRLSGHQLAEIRLEEAKAVAVHEHVLAGQPYQSLEPRVVPSPWLALVPFSAAILAAAAAVAFAMRR